MESITQRLSLNIFSGDVVQPALRADFMNSENIWMVQRGCCIRFVLESTEPLAIVCEFRGEYLDCGGPSELSVMGQVDFSHAALTDEGTDLITTEACANSYSHDRYSDFKLRDEG